MENEKEGVFYKREKDKLPKEPSVAEHRDFGALKEVFRPHIESFNYMIECGLKDMLSAIHPVTVFDSVNNKKLKIRFGEPQLYQPQKERGSRTARDPLYPFECRQARVSYCGKFLAEVKFQYGDGVEITEKFDFGQFPIMLKSKLCHLRDADPQTLVSFKEEASEMGGYFIMNGLERVVRLLIQPKRNHPMGTVRRSFTDKKDGFSDTAISMRCVREDLSSVTIRLHYLNNGSARLAFWIHGNEKLVPVGLVLKALVDTTDYEIYSSLTCTGTPNVAERAKIILDEVRDLSLLTRMQCLEHLGRKFLSDTRGMEKESYSAVADAVLNNYILVHVSNNEDKFILLIDMLLRLFSLIDKKYLPDNPDSLQNQEVLLPGHLITIYLKEKLEDWLEKGRECLQKDVDDESKDFEFSSAYMKKMMDKTPPKQISSAIENMLKTGRLATKTGLDLQQRAGMTVQAERLNFLRFISHFCAVHRGASFAGLRTTSVRKLLPESWGFLCPVHTPDGEPCGLLNHMTCSCRITSQYDSDGNLRNFFELKKSILSVLVGVGMTPALPRQVHAGPPEAISVFLDGCIVGSIPSTVAEKAVSHLRRLKLSAISGIPDDLEVGYVPLSMGGAYPGLYLFTSSSRFVRPVRNISVPDEKNDIELIGPFEQINMEIRCADGGDGGRGNCSPATHEEIHPTGILSVVGNLTPWSNHNQSPRNMYQCQMAKQTMAFSTQALNCRADQKLYHLQTPQTPIVSTKTYEKYCIDEYPSGTNAIVAVLAYSGYDMEDAMLLNKSSVERGMFRGHIYQTESIDLAEHTSKSDQDQKKFRRCYLDKKSHSFIDSDGLPYVGQKIKQNDPYYTVYDEGTSKAKSVMLKASEPVIVDYVAVDMKNQKGLQKANIRFRRSRNPVIGDKFSSRHGQKGVCSQLWADVDMPFSGVTGMRPDLIINPHAFPSRMTIAMLLESIAAKGGCLSGQYVDATPFSSSVKKGNGESETESGSLVDEIGSQLASYGFNYHGSEVLYSGFYGTELTCEIFMGPVYYQRLRHMVSDKFQVRATGLVDPLTRQPLKGRKRGGGIRFGEMERDSLLAHGAAYLLHDRLHLSSDYHIADVCSICGSILTTSLIQTPKRAVLERNGLPPAKPAKKVICISCKSTRGMETVAVPYVFRYLTAELAAMNIQVELKLSNGAGT